MRVRIVRYSGANVIVEWAEDVDGVITYRRTVLPATGIDGRVDQRMEVMDADQGAPYGEPWAELLAENGVWPTAAETIANELHRVGIWTLEDLQTRPSDALAAFQKGYGVDIQRLRQLAQARRSPR